MVPMPSLHSLSCKILSCLRAYYSQVQAGPAHDCLPVAIMFRNQLTTLLTLSPIECWPVRALPFILICLRLNWLTADPGWQLPSQGKLVAGISEFWSDDWHWNGDNVFLVMTKMTRMSGLLEALAMRFANQGGWRPCNKISNEAFVWIL